MKNFKFCYYAGMVLSLLVGLWHFFIPHLYGWYSYIPKEYQVLSITIDYVNICFSMFLFGLSALLIWWGKRIFEQNKEAITLYVFMTFIWVARTVIGIVKPIPDEANPWLSYGQLIGSIVIAVLLITPLVKLHIQNKKERVEND
ncbi:MAG: hypothetical protein RR495_04115 [Anaerovoracaceae bacterium]